MKGHTKLTRLEIVIMSSMTYSRAINGSKGSSQTEKLCEMHRCWMTEVDVEIEPKEPDQKTERTNGKQKSKRKQSTPNRKSTRKKAEKLDGFGVDDEKKEKKEDESERTIYVV